jgi:small subunit ribosomal protein S6
VLIQFTSAPDLVKEVERRMRVADQVIKFITVRIDEKLKKIEKRKKVREKRALRRPKPAAAQPSLAQQMLGGGSEEAHALPGLPVVAHAAPGAPEPVAASTPEPVAATTQE